MEFFEAVITLNRSKEEKNNVQHIIPARFLLFLCDAVRRMNVLEEGHSLPLSLFSGTTSN
jgi:hypothetical protein